MTKDFNSNVQTIKRVLNIDLKKKHLIEKLPIKN